MGTVSLSPLSLRHMGLSIVTFEDIDSRTRVTDSAVFQTVEDRDGMLQSGRRKGQPNSGSALKISSRGLIQRPDGNPRGNPPSRTAKQNLGNPASALGLRGVAWHDAGCPGIRVGSGDGRCASSGGPLSEA
jgi:hypothetical protein